ncbi:MAG: type II secretion system protein [Sedimentibacter sp.]|uniref:type IV pilus modification PilV family protein n=1 Tax=Sedimentibacter sp. TaxID=1960295 RepID=UPI002980C7EA|nr:type II secretion system protein [Sedimentibacter sp.]MDW5300401.1 type II secretion system protein [Sedimentibacter sp.]
MKEVISMRKLLNNKGLTLIEIIITLAVLGIVIAPLMSMFITSQKINTESENEYNAIQLAQKYMEEIKGMDVLDTDNADGYPYITSEDTYKRNLTEDGYDLTISVKKAGMQSGEVGVDNPADLVTEFSTLKIKKESVIYWDGFGTVTNNGNGDVDIVITNADKKNIKVLLNTDAEIGITNERSDEVTLYIYNIVGDTTYDCVVDVVKGQVNKIYNNYTEDEDDIVSFDKTAKNILYNINIHVEKDGEKVIDDIIGSTIFKYEP